MEVFAYVAVTRVAMQWERDINAEVRMQNAECRIEEMRFWNYAAFFIFILRSAF